MSEIQCPVCTTPFKPYREHQRVCSKVCYRRLPDVRAKGRVYDRQSTVAERKNAARRLATASDPDAVRRRNRASNLSRYGLTVEEHDAMLAAQGGVCAICGNPPNPDGVGPASRLHVDHDHETGEVRSLLCNECNRGIGFLKDSPALLRAAADYLQAHKE